MTKLMFKKGDRVVWSRLTKLDGDPKYWIDGYPEGQVGTIVKVLPQYNFYDVMLDQALSGNKLWMFMEDMLDPLGGPW